MVEQSVLLLHPKIAPETISEGLEFKIFLGDMPPDPPLAVALRAPSLNVARICTGRLTSE